MTKTPRHFEIELEINASRAQVWTALTDGDEIARWFAKDASVTPGVGGAVSWQWGDAHTWNQTIDVWEPGQKLQTRYDSTVDDGDGKKRPLLMEFELRGEGGSTTLRVVHSGFDDDAGFDKEYDGISRGWPVELQSLKLYLETHRGRDRRLAWRVVSFDCTHEEAWKRITGDSGFGCGEEIDQLQMGAPFSFQSAGGDLFRGRALVCAEHEFTGQVDNLGGAFLRISVEACGDTSQVWCWLAGYTDKVGDVAAIEARFGAMMDQLFDSHRVTNTAGTGRR